MWSSARLELAIYMRKWADENLDIILIVVSSVNGRVTFFKDEIDNCLTDEDLLEMLHNRLDVKQEKT